MNCEIEFLPVGDASKAGDAIVIRYGDVNSYELMVIDGGNVDSGTATVEHIRSEFGEDSIITHALLTHPDADHASGLRTILSELPVQNLWLHIPWMQAAAARPYFADKRWTNDGLAAALKKEYDIIAEIVDIALEKGISIHYPFAGTKIGPFEVLSPSETAYTLLLPQFDRTPYADQAAIQAAGLWIGKAARPGTVAALLEKAAAIVKSWIEETWHTESLRDGGITTASNESSVVLYGDFGERRVLLTADAGIQALKTAADYANQRGLLLQEFAFVQVPHHGSRRNVGPAVLDRIIGPVQPEGTSKFTAFVSVPKDDEKHPREIVLNAFRRRGGRVLLTQGQKTVHFGGFPARPDYVHVDPTPFSTRVEEYD